MPKYFMPEALPTRSRWGDGQSWFFSSNYYLHVFFCYDTFEEWSCVQHLLDLSSEKGAAESDMKNGEKSESAAIG